MSQMQFQLVMPESFGLGPLIRPVRQGHPSALDTLGTLKVDLKVLLGLAMPAVLY